MADGNVNPAQAASARRVDEGVTTLTPHRSGCAALLHPVPHERASLTPAMPRHSGRLSTVVSLTGLQGAVSLPVSRQWVSPTTPPFPSSGPSEPGSPLSTVL